MKVFHLRMLQPFKGLKPPNQIIRVFGLFLISTSNQFIQFFLQHSIPFGLYVIGLHNFLPTLCLSPTNCPSISSSVEVLLSCHHCWWLQYPYYSPSLLTGFQFLYFQRFCFIFFKSVFIFLKDEDAHPLLHSPSSQWFGTRPGQWQDKELNSGG